MPTSPASTASRVIAAIGLPLSARFHAEVALIYAIETGLCAEGAEPEEIDVVFTGAP